ncbi:hypothetical protein cypCar_00015511 [Cyprinus carpio]|nr:hypothetical protein cypCar_00015511 [Cyprinus carpio]
MVQRLAKDGCRLLHSPLRATEKPTEGRETDRDEKTGNLLGDNVTPPPHQPSSDAAVRVSERERSHEVLLPQRTTSPRAPPSSSSWTGR